MKELSIEEKAKRYDEAIERAKKVLLDCTSEERKVVEYISPELAKSEDDRIRKDIISFVEQAIDAGYGIISKERKEKWIAWLEKQSRLMKALQISNARIGELIEKNYCLKEQLEKQGKNNMGISEATKQKLEDNLHKALEKETPESFNKFLDEQDEQKPAAWSEEDEEMYTATIFALAGFIGNEDVLDWLKSLKDRYTWKPSDEQIIELHRVISGCSYDIEPLVELETKLKEL